MAENQVYSTPMPNPDLQAFNKLVGQWEVSGGAEGHVSYEWMEGGFFLIQNVELMHDGRLIKGMEIIGHDQAFGAEPSADIKSRFFDTLGNTLHYVYEIEDDVLTIWGGEKGSPAYYQGKFSEDGGSVIGGWVYPGGGYNTVMTRKSS